MAFAATPVRVSVIGLGTVGEWLLRAIDRHEQRLRDRYSVDLRVVALASRREGFLYSEQGIPLGEALARRSAGEPLAALDGVTSSASALGGLRETDTDVVVEVSQSPRSDGEPGLSHMRAALERGCAVATSNKWPVALAGVELSELARQQGRGFRAESTVMSGTPLLSTLTDGLGGVMPRRLRGVLNASANFICSRMNERVGYPEALAEAQAAGLTEADPSDDVDGLDSVAKLMVLSALVLRTQLEIDAVEYRGISRIGPEEHEAAVAEGRRIREVTTLDPEAGRFTVEPVAVRSDDRLFAIDGSANALEVTVDPLGELVIVGPGAGRRLAGQGVFADVIALAREARIRTAG